MNLKLKKQIKAFLLQQTFYSVDEYFSYVYVWECMVFVTILPI